MHKNQIYKGFTQVQLSDQVQKRIHFSMKVVTLIM